MTILNRLRMVKQALFGAEPTGAPQDFIPFEECRWLEAEYNCKFTVNSDENLPSGCDHLCPARIQNEMRAKYRAEENHARLFQ